MTEVEQKAVELYDQGLDMADQGQHKEAYEKFHAATELIADWPNAHYNAGISAFLAEMYAEALPHFIELKRLEPDGWVAREKLVQTYQALGRSAERDAERKELFERFETTSDEKYKQHNSYVRDQFVHRGQRIFVYEYFVPPPPFNTIYEAVIPPAQEGEQKRRVCMESPDETTNMAREMGEIGPDERIYSIDGYQIDGKSHSTFDLSPQKRTYDEFRTSLLKILDTL